MLTSSLGGPLEEKEPECVPPPKDTDSGLDFCFANDTSQ